MNKDKLNAVIASLPISLPLCLLLGIVAYTTPALVIVILILSGYVFATIKWMKYWINK